VLFLLMIAKFIALTEHSADVVAIF
jgi:hypothetical protein